jgi:hypothetical protein
MISFSVSIVPYKMGEKIPCARPVQLGSEPVGVTKPDDVIMHDGYRATARISSRTIDFVEIRRTQKEALDAILVTVKREI